MRDLADRGLTCERYADLAQDSSGIWTSPGGALVAWFKDPDGHTLVDAVPGVNDLAPVSIAVFSCRRVPDSPLPGARRRLPVGPFLFQEKTWPAFPTFTNF